MYRHRASRFRRLHPKGPTRWQQMQQRFGLVLLIPAGLVTALLLLAAPLFYLQNKDLSARNAFGDAHWADFDAVERHWKALPILPSVRTGREPEVRRFLEAQPLVVALLDRFGGRTLWVREGNHLVRANQGPELQLYLDWMTHAEMAQLFEWNPPKNQDPDFGKTASVVLLSDRWLVIKRWKPGSPAVEKELHVSLGPHPSVRIGLIRKKEVRSNNLQVQPWGKAPLLQADPYRMAYYSMNAILDTNAFGVGWDLGGIPFEAEEIAYRKTLKKELVGSYAVSLAVGLAIGFGLWIRYRARRRAVLDADRMASLTHSLKTPLAILKFRCDSLRLGRLTPDQADEELLKLGDEVDRLAVIIENGLRVIRGGGSTGPKAEATPEWFQNVLEDFMPALEMEGRKLQVDLCERHGKAPLSSLRASIITLLENALGHGRGTVTLETACSRRRLAIRVQDEGDGLAPHELKALGKPFQRFRERGKEGFTREGQGLGLSLLVQVAQMEGWGLSFASAPGEGLTATLEIPVG